MQSLSHILTPARTVCHASGNSKKRLFEVIAEVVSRDQPDLPYADVLDKLVAREQLGSTGLGRGIALPHCRMGECPQPLGALISLEEPIAFDAPDDRPVDLLFVLLVPAEANQEHLDILAAIARRFSDPDYCARLRAAADDDALYAAATGEPG